MEGEVEAEVRELWGTCLRGLQPSVFFWKGQQLASREPERRGRTLVVPLTGATGFDLK